MSDPSNTYLSEPELDARWGKKPGYSAELRARGEGPPFTRLSARVFRYRLDRVQEFEQCRTFKSNAEMLAAVNDDPPEAA